MQHPQLKFRVFGMDCVEEVTILKRQLTPLVGREEALSFDLLNAKLTVDVTSERVSPASVLDAIRQTGMKAELFERDAARRKPLTFWQAQGRTVLTIVCGVLVAIGFALDTLLSKWPVFESQPLLNAEFYARASYLLAIVCGMGMVFPKAWRSLATVRPDMNLLMTVAVLGAVVIGEWLEGAMVAFLFSVSLVLESWSVGRARRAIAALMDLSPDIARIQEPGHDHLHEMPPDAVEVGSIAVVRPGEKIPLDGLVRSGISNVNQASITGESAPVEKTIGSEVFAGTINGDGLLEIETTRLAGDTTLAHIIQMVSDAQAKRAPAERWVEQFASIYTPVVMLGALLVLVIPPLVAGGSWSDWFYRSLVLLVIACPCALVISTPVSIVAALASAARNGVLIKGGLFVELPGQLRAIAMDKTGTLTQGVLSVVNVVPFHGHDEIELLSRAAALEQHSTHPLARAIILEANKRQVVIPTATEFSILPGKGAIGAIEGQMFWIGSHRMLQDRGQESQEVMRHLEEMQANGQSVVVVGNDKHVCGLIALSDTLRADSRRTIDRLRQLGIENLTLLTGDHVRTAEHIAKQAGVDAFHAELLPAEKVAWIEELSTRFGRVAMIGDGVNDAPALARADIGIAMGAAGSDAAIESADIALMSDDLAKLPWLIEHSRRTLRIIRQNIFFSLAIKAVFVVMTFAGFASLWAAIAADTGASLAVVANGLRLLQARSDSD